MPTLSEVIASNLPKVQHSYTAEELEAAKRKMAEKLARELGMCSADCPHCQGLGYVRDGSGGVVMCPNVDRWQLPSAARIGISRQEADTLDWSQVLERGGIKRAVDALQRVLSWGFGWVYLHGDYGVGKTLLLKVAVAEALRSHKEAAYVRMPEIIDHLRETFNEKTGESESARLDWWTDLPVLCIDEMDKLRETPYGDERRFVLMDRRYEQALRMESITIMASNKPPDDLPGYLADRVRDGRFFVIKITAKSLRPGLAWTHPATGEVEVLE